MFSKKNIEFLTMAENNSRFYVNEKEMWWNIFFHVNRIFKHQKISVSHEPIVNLLLQNRTELTQFND